MADTALEPDATETDESPSLGEPTVVCDGVHITYRVYEDRRPTMHEFVARRFRSREYRQIHAVRGVDLVARAGEIVGVIGRNGSGKSTLLRAIAGLMPCNQGQVLVRSQPAILGVGAALQPKLSGRRNIELGALALGMSRAELAEKMDSIIEFSGLAGSIDLPLQTYSSGMRARLHFAVATAVIPDILLIDEALAVGDEQFRQRSEARIEELRDGAGTVFIVSHGLGVIKEMCTRAVWLHDGAVRADGEPRDVVRAYKKSNE